MAMPAEVPPDIPSHWLPYFAVADVEEACARVGELGGSVLVPPMTVQEMRVAVAQDPAGAVFGLLQTVHRGPDGTPWTGPLRGRSDAVWAAP